MFLSLINALGRNPYGHILKKVDVLFLGSFQTQDAANWWARNWVHVLKSMTVGHTQEGLSSPPGGIHDFWKNNSLSWENSTWMWRTDVKGKGGIMFGALRWEWFPKETEFTISRMASVWRRAKGRAESRKVEMSPHLSGPHKSCLGHWLWSPKVVSKWIYQKL